VAEYKAFLRTRDNLHKWSQHQREHLWAVIKSEAEAATEPWEKAVRLKVEAENAPHSINFAIDSFRINFAHRITPTIEQNLQDERTFWQQLGATFNGKSAMLHEGIKAGDTEQELVEKHIAWGNRLIERCERLDKLASHSFWKNASGTRTIRAAQENRRTSLNKLFASTVPYYPWTQGHGAAERAVGIRRSADR
jgi:hypothetical protein